MNTTDAIFSGGSHFGTAAEGIDIKTARERVAAPTIAVLMTCHNRKNLTLASIGAIKEAVDGAAEVSVFLVDDGSTDGTSDAVRSRFPETRILRGDGNLFWNRGMHMAWQAATQMSPAFYLWLNDDLALRPGSVAELLEVYCRHAPRTIVVGTTVDPETREITYGGYRRRGLSRIGFRRLDPTEVECDSMNGNCVLIPGAAAQEVGLSDNRFRHAFGDHDYAFRARRRGYALVEHKTPVGTQRKNVAYIEQTATLTLRNWKFILRHPKGVPFREWLQFCARYGGPLWPVNFLLRYARMIGNSRRARSAS